MDLKEEESNCNDVHRLTAIIHVTLGLVGADNNIQMVRTLCNASVSLGMGIRVLTPLSYLLAFQELLAFLCKLLMHPFPRVRRITAENFYVKLGEQAELNEDHPALKLLLTSPWDGPDSEMDVTQMAMKVASALDVMKLLQETQI